MEIVNARQIVAWELQELSFDVFIFCHSGDARWSLLDQKYPVSAKRRILLLLKDFDELFPDGTTGVIDLSRSEVFRLNSSDNEGFFQFFGAVLEETGRTNPRILVDISCFPRQWIGALLHYLFVDEGNHSEVHLLLAYIPSPFYLPPRFRKIRQADRLMDLQWNRNSKLPLALFLILGYDNLTGNVLIDSLKPEKIVVFYTASDFDLKITNEIEKRHKKLISSLPASQIITYPLNNLHKVNAIITSEILRWRLTHKVSLAVMGPKILTALSLVLQIRYPDIEVWDPGDIDLHPNPIPSSFPPLIYQIHFEQAEDL